MPPQDRFTLAFLDPPYGRSLVEPALVELRDGGWLAKEALCVVEESGDTKLALPEGYELLERRDYGETQVVILRAH
jgi:16S rRNA (guanine966-N2)-methyltransferase